MPAAVDCFASVQRTAFDPAALPAMRDRLTPEQYEALRAIAEQGGPDLDAITSLRAAKEDRL